MKTKILIVGLMMAALNVFGQFGPSAVIKYPYSNVLNQSDVFIFGIPGNTNKNIAASNMLNAIHGANPAMLPAIMNTNGLVVFNVEKYGAVSGQDSTAAIQASFNAAQSVGGISYFPSNGYITTAPLLVSNAMTIQGNLRAGAEPTITNTAGTDIIVCPNGFYNFSIKDMVLASPSGPSATNTAIRLASDPDHGFGLALIDKVDAYGGRYGLWATNMFTSEIINTRFLTNQVGAWFQGTTVGRIKIEGGGAGSGTAIGYHIDQGSYFVFDGVDCGGLTNMLKVTKPAFVTVQNSNMEGGLAASDATFDTAYIKFHSETSGGILRISNNRFGAGNNPSAALTNVYVVSVSNAFLAVHDGNTFSTDGPTGQPVEEWGTIPCPTYVTSPENYSSQLWVTNRTVNVARKARQYVQDLQNSGRSANFSNPLYWGAVWYDSRASGASDSLWHHIKLVNDTHAGVDLYDFYKQSQYNTKLLVGTNAGAGFSGASSLVGLDVSARWFVLGANNNATSRTNNGFKSFAFAYPPYSTARGPVLAMTGYAGNSGDGFGIQNRVTLGGGSSSGDAATILDLNTGALDSTTSTTKLRVTDSAVNVHTNLNTQAIITTNGASFRLIAAIPTNSVPLGSATETNWAICNIAGVPTTLATNRAGGGWMRWDYAAAAWVAYP